MDLVKKYSEGIPYTQDELDNFYCEESDGSYVVCCNDNGDCFVEDFKLYSSVLLYFNSGLDLQEIYDNEKERLRYLDRWGHKIATYIFCEASRHTESGQYYVYFKNINSFYGINLESDRDLQNKIIDILNEEFSNVIIDFDVYEDDSKWRFDMNLFTNYCCNDTDFEDELWEEE
jgi:hypothetical protein